MSILELTSAEFINLCDSGDIDSVGSVLKQIAQLPPGKKESVLNRLNDFPSSQFSAGHIACLNDDDALLYLLSKGGISLSLPLKQSLTHPKYGVIPKGSTPLHIAARANAVACAQLLLDLPISININSRDSNSHTPLFGAAVYNSFSVLQVIASHPKHKLDSALATERPVDLYTPTQQHWPKGATAVMAAAANSSVSLALLLKEYADIHLCDDNGYTAVHYACQYHNADALALLIDAKADVEARSINQTSLTAKFVTPLHVCVRHVPLSLTNGSRPAYLHCVLLLLRARANVNAQDARGFTPLHCAAMQRDGGAMQLLVDYCGKFDCPLNLTLGTVQKVSVAQGGSSLEVVPGTTAYRLARARQAYDCCEALLRYERWTKREEARMDDMRRSGSDLSNALAGTSAAAARKDAFETYVQTKLGVEAALTAEVSRLRALLELVATHGAEALEAADMDAEAVAQVQTREGGMTAHDSQRGGLLAGVGSEAEVDLFAAAQMYAALAIAGGKNADASGEFAGALIAGAALSGSLASGMSTPGPLSVFTPAGSAIPMGGTTPRGLATPLAGTPRRASFAPAHLLSPAQPHTPAAMATSLGPASFAPTGLLLSPSSLPTLAGAPVAYSSRAAPAFARIAAEAQAQAAVPVSEREGLDADTAALRAGFEPAELDLVRTASPLPDSHSLGRERAIDAAIASAGQALRTSAPSTGVEKDERSRKSKSGRQFAVIADAPEEADAGSASLPADSVAAPDGEPAPAVLADLPPVTPVKSSGLARAIQAFHTPQRGDAPDAAQPAVPIAITPVTPQPIARASARSVGGPLDGGLPASVATSSLMSGSLASGSVLTGSVLGAQGVSVGLKQMIMGSVSHTSAVLEHSDEKHELQMQVRILTRKLQELKKERKAATTQLEAKLAAVSEQCRAHEARAVELHVQLQEREDAEAKLREDYKKLKETIAANDNEKERRREREKYERERANCLQQLESERGKVTLREDMIKRLERAIKERDTELDRERARMRAMEEKARPNDSYHVVTINGSDDSLATPLLQPLQGKETGDVKKKGSCCVIC